MPVSFEAILVCQAPSFTCMCIGVYVCVCWPVCGACLCVLVCVCIRMLQIGKLNLLFLHA